MNGHAERLTNGEIMSDGHVTGIPTVAVTEQRKPFVSTHGAKLQHPGTYLCPFDLHGRLNPY